MTMNPSSDGVKLSDSGWVNVNFCSVADIAPSDSRTTAACACAASVDTYVVSKRCCMVRDASSPAPTGASVDVSKMFVPLISDDGNGTAEPRCTRCTDNHVPALPADSDLSCDYGNCRSKEEICADA